MPFNGSGTYTVPAGTAATTGTVIDSTAYNAFLLDIQNALSGSLRRNGESALQAHLPAAGFRVTGLGDAVGPQDAVTKAQLDAKNTARVLTGPSVDGVGGDVPLIYAQGAPSTASETLPMIRERNLGGAQGGNLGAAPSLSWYWAGVDAGQIRFTSGLFSFLDNVGGFAAVESNFFRGTIAVLGRPSPGAGGHLQLIDDGGTYRWATGFAPGSVGARDWIVFNNAALRTDFRIDTDGNLYGVANTLTIGGRNASALKTLPTAGVELVSGEVYTAIDGFTVPAGLALNSIYPIYNDLTENITITPAGGVTLRLAGTLLTGARTLGPKGFASLWVRGTNEYVMTGAGLS